MPPFSLLHAGLLTGLPWLVAQATVALLVSAQQPQQLGGLDPCWASTNPRPAQRGFASDYYFSLCCFSFSFVCFSSSSEIQICLNFNNMGTYYICNWARKIH